MIDLMAAKQLKHDVSQLGCRMREVLPDDLGDGLRDKIGDILISASKLLESIESEYNLEDLDEQYRQEAAARRRALKERVDGK
jgi:hypothetical protein